MKKSFNRLMVMLLVMGLVVAAAGLAMGGSTSIIWGADGPRAMRDERKSLDVTEQLSFTELRVDTSVVELRVVDGDAFRIEATYVDGSEPGYSLDGGVLRVFDSGKGDRSHRINVGIELNEPNKMTVTLPRGTDLARAEISVDVGDMWLEGFSADALEAHNATGKIDMRDIACDDLEINANVGSIALSGVSTTRRMVATSNTGSVKGSGSFGGDVRLTADVGSIDIEVGLARDQVMLDAKASIGSVTISPNAPNPAAAPNAMQLRSGVGSVSVRFAP